MSMNVIAAYLLRGARLHGFLSGGGLRVFRVERDGDLIGYGEHVTADEALSFLADDLHAGGREYADVYGGEHPMYLTGAADTTTPLDAWIRQGRTVDAYLDGDTGAAIVELHGYQHNEMPAGMMERVLKTGDPERYDRRGYCYEVMRSSFPSGEPCVCIATISAPPNRSGSDAHMWPIVKRGRAETLAAALEAALAAEGIEA
jgi:hypothetical protein